MILNICYCLVAYLLGNILGGKILEFISKEQFTNRGSGNIGARNAGRVLGPKFFTFVLAVDFFKGFLVIILLKIFNANLTVIALCMFLVILGHIKPIVFKFKGGKGVATYFGALAAFSIHLFLVMILCTLVVAIVLKSTTIGFYLALPIIVYLSYFEYHSFLVSVIFVFIAVLLYFVSLEDIEKSFRKYFLTKKRVVNKEI